MGIKKSRILEKIILLLILLISILQVSSFASSSDRIILQEENQYYIYIEELLNKEFEFAFSNSKEENPVNYINSAKDNSGNNIAYVDEQLKTEFFDSEETYIWAKSDGELKIQGERVTLDEALTKEQLESMENLTKTITIQSSAEEEQIKINGDSTKEYYYKIVSANSVESYNQLVNLVKETNQYTEDTNAYTKLKTYKELYELYNNLKVEAAAEEWVKVNDLSITKPYEAKGEQQYILWLKDDEGNVDIQFLTAYEKTVENTETREVEKEVAVATPVTYDDSIALIYALCIVCVLIVTILIIKIITKNDIKHVSKH